MCHQLGTSGGQSWGRDQRGTVHRSSTCTVDHLQWQCTAGRSCTLHCNRRLRWEVQQGQTVVGKHVIVAACSAAPCCRHTGADHISGNHAAHACPAMNSQLLLSRRFLHVKPDPVEQAFQPAWHAWHFPLLLKQRLLEAGHWQLSLQSSSGSLASHSCSQRQHSRKQRCNPVPRNWLAAAHLPGRASARPCLHRRRVHCKGVLDHACAPPPASTESYGPHRHFAGVVGSTERLVRVNLAEGFCKAQLAAQRGAQAVVPFPWHVNRVFRAAAVPLLQLHRQFWPGWPLEEATACSRLSPRYVR